VTAANGRVGSFSTEAILPHRRPLGLRATWSYAKAWKLVEPPAGETKLKLDVLSVYVAFGSHTTKDAAIFSGNVGLGRQRSATTL